MPTLSQDRTLPVSITQLRLCSALGKCGALGVAGAFDKSKANSLFVYDDKTLGYTDWTDQEPEFASICFRVNNPSGIDIVLLPFDHRIMTGPNIIVGGICDCAILTQNELSFIEFKTDVASTNDLTILQRADEAIGQILHTYFDIVLPGCESVSVNLQQKVAVDFHVKFNELFMIAGANASLMEKQDDFVNEYNIPLFFDHEKIFN